MKKTLRTLSLTIGSIAAILTVTSCGNSGGGLKPVAKEDLKIGMVCIGDPSTSTYDKNFKNGLDAAAAHKGLSTSQVFYKKEAGENETAKAAAIDLADNGCNIVILNSYGHQFWSEEVAKMYPSVRFVSCTGDLAATQKLPNLYNAFASIYEGRYLAGIAAGMKLNELIAPGGVKEGSSPVMGYVAAFPYAEVISGYTAFYLGAKSVCPNVTMKYTVTNSWGDSEKERSAASALINAGALLVSQHADTYGAPNACKNAGVPNVSYNISTKNETPDTFLTYSRIEWAPYFEYLIDCTINNTTVSYDWVGGVKEGSVISDDLGKCAAAGTAEAINAAKTKFNNGTLHVFDTSTFTVGGAAVTTCTKEFAGGKKECIVEDGKGGHYFAESLYRSAPYFDLAIDGISELAAVK